MALDAKQPLGLGVGVRGAWGCGIHGAHGVGGGFGEHVGGDLPDVPRSLLAIRTNEYT